VESDYRSLQFMLLHFYIVHASVEEPRLENRGHRASSLIFNLGNGDLIQKLWIIEANVY